MEPIRPQEANARRRRLSPGIVAAGAAFGLTLAGLGVASAQSESAQTTTTTATAAGEAPRRAERPAETALTGKVAGKVRAAARAAVPRGTVVRVETDSDGSPYEAHVRRPDGTGVVVEVDEAFRVTAVEEARMGRKGHGRGAGRPALAGDVAEKIRAATVAAVPGATFLRAGGPWDGAAYHAHVRNADGTALVVMLDDTFAVTGTEARTGGPGPGGRHHHRPRPGDSGAQAD